VTKRRLYDRGDRELEKESKDPFTAVFDFVFGPMEARPGHRRPSPPGLPAEFTLGELAQRSGVSMERAAELGAELVAAGNGEVLVRDGEIVCRIEGPDRSPALAEPPAKAAPAPLTGNRPLTNLMIVFFFGCLAFTLFMFIGAALAAKSWSVAFYWIELAFTLTVLLLPIVRALHPRVR
jgi:hypothetical protein